MRLAEASHAGCDDSDVSEGSFGAWLGCSEMQRSWRVSDGCPRQRYALKMRGGRWPATDSQQIGDFAAWILSLEPNANFRLVQNLRIRVP